jgi:amino-acid N-acetyltransferase
MMTDNALTGRLRKAHTGDVARMQEMINGFAERNLMLPRSLSELYETLRDFFVVEEEGMVVGCSALHVSWKNLAELKSLAVDERYQGRGYGKRLVAACLEEAEILRVGNVFALTYVPELFLKAQFEIVEKATLPRKVWTECINCPKFPDCGEIAVLKNLDSAQTLAPPSLFPLELQPIRVPNEVPYERR